MIPTRCGPTSLEVNSQLLFPRGIGRSARFSRLCGYRHNHLTSPWTPRTACAFCSSDSPSYAAASPWPCTNRSPSASSYATTSPASTAQNSTTTSPTACLRLAGCELPLFRTPCHRGAVPEHARIAPAYQSHRPLRTHRRRRERHPYRHRRAPRACRRGVAPMNLPYLLSPTSSATRPPPSSRNCSTTSPSPSTDNTSLRSAATTTNVARASARAITGSSNSSSTMRWRSVSPAAPANADTHRARSSHLRHDHRVQRHHRGAGARPHPALRR